MGRVDPESVSAANVTGGLPTTVYVKFVQPMPAYEQNPVTYSGNVEALLPTPPAKCPFPACGADLGTTSFPVDTVVVSSVQSVTVAVQGPTKTKSCTFQISPP